MIGKAKSMELLDMIQSAGLGNVALGLKSVEQEYHRYPKGKSVFWKRKQPVQRT